MRRTGYVERQLRRWHAQVHAATAEHTSPQALALLDEVHGLLARRVPAQGNGVVHGDFRPGNMAFGLGRHRARGLRLGTGDHR